MIEGYLKEVGPRLELLEVLDVLLARLCHGCRTPDVHQVVANYHRPAKEASEEEFVSNGPSQNG